MDRSRPQSASVSASPKLDSASESLPECRISPARDTVHRDYVFLTREAPAELFGWHKNPLSIRFRETDIPGQPGKTIRVRDKCCLFYCLPGSVPCYTCPRLSDSERIHRWTIHEKGKH